MKVATISDIITHKVLNEETGELESVDFRREKSYKKIRGGFVLMYKSYDEAVGEIISSKLDFALVVSIRDTFTYMRVENVLNKKDIALQFGISPQKVTTTIKKMVEAKLLMRVSRGVYRLNPFMFVPYRADGSILQQEWDRLLENE